MGNEVNQVKVLWVEFENLKTGLKLERINFYKDITLLVGLSGAGKSQILKAVEYSLNLAVRNDVMLEPYHVSIGFLADGAEYSWTYTIDNDPSQLNEIAVTEERYCFIYEKLLRNQKKVFERKHESVEVVGYGKIPKPKKDESLLLQYAEDDNFESLHAALRKLYSIEMELAVRGGISKEAFSHLKSRVEKTIKHKKGVEFKTFSHLPVALKLHIAKEYYYEELYVKIFDAVKELFMEIEDIDVIADEAREMYLVSIQVYGKTLMQNAISSGMLKTIYYIVELFTMSENSLVMIDEFENGLGVNCIDILADMLMHQRNDLQFIVTSHHPKIINQISKEHWRVIERDQSVISNKSSEEYGIGHSQHDAYFNLINIWDYEGKI